MKITFECIRDNSLHSYNERMRAIIEVHLNSGDELLAIVPQSSEAGLAQEYIATIFFKRYG